MEDASLPSLLVEGLRAETRAWVKGEMERQSVDLRDPPGEAALGPPDQPVQGLPAGYLPLEVLWWQVQPWWLWVQCSRL